MAFVSPDAQWTPIVIYGFDIATVASYGEPDADRQLSEPGIVRKRRNVESTIRNARAMWGLIQEHGS